MDLLDMTSHDVSVIIDHTSYLLHNYN